MYQPNEIGERLRIVRKLLNLKQEDISKTLNMGQANFSNIENGRTTLSLNHVGTLFDAYKINPNYLLLGHEPKIVATDKKKDEPVHITMRQLQDILQEIPNAPFARLRQIAKELAEALSYKFDENAKRTEALLRYMERYGPLPGNEDQDPTDPPAEE